MKKDIDFTPVKDVTLTIVKNEDGGWQVFLLNRSEDKLDTVLVTSKGYGQEGYGGTKDLFAATFYPVFRAWNACFS